MFCQSYCSLSPAHLLCSAAGPAARCGSVFSRGLSSSERAAVLAEHNRLRAAVARGETRQPAAADMRELVWDEELARLAQAHAENCRYFVDRAVDLNKKLNINPCFLKLIDVAVGWLLYLAQGKY